MQPVPWEPHFTSYIKSTLNRPHKPDCEEETHQEAADSWTSPGPHWRVWAVRRSLRTLGSSSPATSPSFPRMGPKAQLHRGRNPSMDHLHRDCPATMERPATTTQGHPNIPHGTRPATGEPDSSSGIWLGGGRFVNKMYLPPLLLNHPPPSSLSVCFRISVN